MLRRIGFDSVQINEVIITVDEENNVSISNYKNLNFKSTGDLNIEANKIKMISDDQFWIESKKHLVEVAPHIDLNPEEECAKFQCEEVQSMDEYVIAVNGKVVTYNNFDDIPEKFDFLVKFNPMVPPSPHSEEDHEYIKSIQEKLNILKEREINDS